MDNDIRELIHDIRNPLNSISVNAELGKLTLQRTGDVEKAIRIFETIIKECARGGDRISQLREVLSNSAESAEENRN